MPSKIRKRSLQKKMLYASKSQEIQGKQISYKKNKTAHLSETRLKYNIVNRRSIVKRHILYNEANRKQIIDVQFKYDQEHRHQIRTKQAKYDQEHQHQIRTKQAKYNQEHRHQIRTKQAKYDQEHRHQIRRKQAVYDSEYSAQIRIKKGNYYKKYQNKIRAYKKINSSIIKYWKSKYNMSMRIKIRGRQAAYNRKRALRIAEKQRLYRQRNQQQIRNAQQKRYHRNAPVINKRRRVRYRKKRTHLAMIVQRKRYIQILNEKLSTKLFPKKNKLLRRNFTVKLAEHLVLKAMNKKRVLWAIRGREIEKIRKKIEAAQKNMDPNSSLDMLLGNRLHNTYTEPFFWESSYVVLQQSTRLYVDETGVAHFNFPPAQQNTALKRKKKGQNWQCNDTCKINESDLELLQEFFSLFDSSDVLPSLRSFVSRCEVCLLPNKHGHSLACIDSERCTSGLRSLRCLTPHSPTLVDIVATLYSILRHDKQIQTITEALECGDPDLIKKAIALPGSLEEYFSRSSISDTDVSEIKLVCDYAVHIDKYQKALRSFPIFDCISCERLFYSHQVSKCQSAKLNKSETWFEFLTYIGLSSNDVSCKKICKYCLSKFSNKQTPNRCISNGLHSDDIPQELQSLNHIEKILVQRGKCFQSIFTLGTVTGTSRRPSNQLLKGLKGNVFHLRLPTEATINKITSNDLHILVNGVPTKNRKIWQELVNLQKVHTAIEVLKKINPLYADIQIKTTKEMQEDLELNDDEIPEKAMITQVKDGLGRDSSYHQYTIHPLHQVKNCQNTDLYQMLRVEGDRLDNRDDKTDYLCFPLIYPKGRFGKHHPRTIKISDSEFAKSRLLNKRPYFRRDQPYGFHLFYESELNAVKAGLYHTLRSRRNNKTTAQSFLQSVNANNTELQVNLQTIFRNLRGTKSYWYLRTSELLCMCRELPSPPVWFLTFSCAEYYWPDMEEFLRIANSDISPNTPISKLCVEDPVNVMRHFDNRFKAMLKFMHEAQPLGEITDYFWRLEMQSRGAPHVHLVLWIKDAPIIGINTPEEVMDFIEKHVTCKLPDINNNPKLHELVKKFQTHQCSKYCLKKYRTGNRYVTRCKFGFPRKLTKIAILNDLLSSIRHRRSGKSGKRLYSLRRQLGEERINDYNSLLLLMWESNIDVQYIADSYQAVCYYITKYITKAEKTVLTELWDQISASENLVNRLWKFAFRVLSSRECGAYEAFGRLIGIHLYGKSAPIKYVVAYMHRNRRLKSMNKIEQIAEDCPESTDIFENSWIDVYYPNRPNNMEDLCLYDFIRFHDYEKVQNSQGTRIPINNKLGFLRVRGKPYLINHKIFNPNKEAEREQYFFSLLLFFCPWRNETDLLGPYVSYEKSFKVHSSTLKELHSYHSKLQSLREASDLVEEQLQSDTPASRTEMLSEQRFLEGNILENGIEDIIAELAEAMKSSTQDLDGIVAELNSDQKRVYNKIREHISSEHPNSLRLFISGHGGTGKSFLINAVKCMVNNIYASDNIVIAITAPTGLAAYNVGGITIHKFFQVPVEHGSTASYTELSSASLHILQALLKDLKVIVIDEISMVSNLLLLYIHLRLNEIFPERSEWFGGVNILVFGDLLQLMPVKGQPAFAPLSSKELSEKVGGAGCMNLWKELFVYEELLQNMRQQDDQMYQEILNALRIGKLSSTAEDALKSRVKLADFSIEGACSLYEDCRSNGEAPLCLLPTNNLCSQFNVRMLEISCTSTEVLEAKDSFMKALVAGKNSAAAKRLKNLQDDASRTAGLETSLKLGIGCRVMLRRNINVKSGLVNGAMGTVVDFQRKHGRNEISGISVAFDDDVNQIRTIERISVKFEIGSNIYVERKQFPIVLAYAITVHKSQGLTLKCALIDLGLSMFAEGMAYVALSRVKHLDSVYLLQFHRQSVMTNRSCVEEYNRLRNSFRPDLPEFDVPTIQSTKRKAFNKPASENKKVKVSLIIPEETNDSNRSSRKRVSETCKSSKKTKIDKRTVQHTTWWPGFVNDDGISCYANSALVTLFAQSQFRELLHDSLHQFPDNSLLDILTEILNQHQATTTTTRLTTYPVRQVLGPPFTDNAQQDVTEFLLSLIGNLPDCMKNIFYHQVCTQYLCNNCNYSWNANATPSLFHQIYLPANGNVPFKELFGYYATDLNCQHCASKTVRSREVIVEASRYLFLHIIRFHDDTTKINTLVSGFNSRGTIIDGHKYRCKSVIQHLGHSINSGHYKSFISIEGGWLEYNDDRTTKKMRLMGSLRDVYVILMEKIS